MDAVTNLARNAQAFTSNVYLVEGERTVLVDAGTSFDVALTEESFGEDVAIVLRHPLAETLEEVVGGAVHARVPWRTDWNLDELLSGSTSLAGLLVGAHRPDSPLGAAGAW